MSETFPRPFNDNYELLGLLGKGGMGSKVYKARQLSIDRIVALKVLDINSADDEQEKRFESEAKAMKELSHSNLVTVFDYGRYKDLETGGEQVYIAMTFVDGKPLSDILKEKKKMSATEATYIALQVARGLEYAHEREVIHRDIKPSNIMVTSDWRAYIIDFGISLLRDSQRLTSVGMTMGTPEYMSPEQCQNKNVTKQSDIYSLGIVFYEMLAGDPPFIGGASLAILNKHLNEKPAPLANKNSNVPASLEKIIDKALEKKPENRYANFAEFINDLNSDGVSNAQKRQQTLIERLTKPEKLMLAILCAIPILLILVILLLSFKSVPEPPKSVVLLGSGQNAGSSGKAGGFFVKSVLGVDSAALFDGSLSSAWRIKKESALKANNGIFLSVKFAKPTLITNLGFAIGDQSDWDSFQKFSKPKEIWVRYINSNVKEYKVNEQSSSRKIIFDDRLGVQYPLWNPVEVTELMFELRSVQNDKVLEDFAISELRLLGMEM